MSIVQEKFQITQPQNHNDEERGWVTDKSARVAKGFPGKSNRMPPGQDIEDQAQTDQRSFPMRMASEGDVTPDYSQRAMTTGYTPHRCCPTDDEYTNAHTDAFYDSVKVDGVEGFVERNNMLDRL